MPEKKVPERKIAEKKVPVPKKEAAPPAKGIFGKIFSVSSHIIAWWKPFFFHLHFLCVWKNKFLKVDALSGRTVVEEKISVAFHKEEVVRERTELEVVETPVEVLEEEEFHEVQEYFEEEEFHEVEEFIKVERPRVEEVHRAEEVHRVIEVLETEEVEVYEKPKAPPKGIGEFCCYNKLLYLALTQFFFF